MNFKIFLALCILFYCFEWIIPANAIDSSSGLNVNIATDLDILALRQLQDGSLAGCAFSKVYIFDSNYAVKKLLNTYCYSLIVLKAGSLAVGVSTTSIYDTSSWSILKNLTGHSEPVNSLALLSDAYLASGSSDKTVKIWNTNTGELIRTLTGHASSVTSLAVLSDGTLASGSSDSLIKIWNTTSSSSLIRNLVGHQMKINSLVLLNDATLASSSNDSTLKIWNTTSGTAVKSFPVSQFLSLETLLDDGTLIGTATNEIYLLNLKNNDAPQIYETNSTANILDMTVLKDGRFAKSNDDNTIQIGLINDFLQNNIPTSLTIRTTFVNSLAAIVNSVMLAGGASDYSIKIWNMNNGSLIRTLTGHNATVSALAALRDGTLASGSFDSTIKIWNVTTGSLMKTLIGQSQRVTSLAVLLDGTLVSAASDSVIKFWNVTTGALLRRISTNQNNLKKIDITPDQRLFFSGEYSYSGSSLKVWDQISGTLINTIKIPYLTTWVILPFGKLAYISSINNYISIINFNTNSLVKTLNLGNNITFSDITLLVDGRFVSTQFENSGPTIRIWDINTYALLKTNKMSENVNWLYPLSGRRLAEGMADKIKIDFISDCKDGWIYYEMKCYFLVVNTIQDFYSAETYCESLGSHLTYVKNKTEIDFTTGFWGYWLNQYSVNYLWSGMIAVAPGSYKWLDGTNQTNYWCNGQPDNSYVINRIQEGCGAYNVGRQCFESFLCRNGEKDSLAKPNANGFICQYELVNSSYSIAIQIPAAPSTLETGFSLHTNDYILSDNKLYKLILQEDGNLVLYKNNSNMIWSSNTKYTIQNPNPVSLILMENGNLVLQNSASQNNWQSDSGSADSTKQPYQLKIHNDGYIVILDKYNSPVWSSLYQLISTTTTTTTTTTINQLTILSEGMQCGGIGYSGPTQCDAGLVCYIFTDYYYKCIRSTDTACTIFPSKTTSTYKNWALEGYVSPVKDQQTCNACWAFGVTSALESYDMIYNKKTNLYSEQHLVDCVGIGNCYAGFPDVAARFVLTDGIYKQFEYFSWNNSRGQCVLSRGGQIDGLNGYQTIINDELLMKTVLDKIGPIIVSFNSDGLSGYKGGIINDPNCSPGLDHVALAVGYGTDPILGLDYYIVKNSWGSSWGENGYFRIARGKDMCGIGRSAIYLCPDKICTGSRHGVSSFKPTPNCQCDGKGFIGTNLCANNGNCFAKANNYYECTPASVCPSNWTCAQNQAIKRSISSGYAFLGDRCDINGPIVCAEGSCYSQNFWFAQCLNRCPEGWACQTTNSNSTDLKLWKEDGQENYYKKLNSTNWVYIYYSKVILNLLFYTQVNDTIVLSDPNTNLYHSINSQYLYIGLTIQSAYSSKYITGSWQIYYYEAQSNREVWTFQDTGTIFGDSYFISLESQVNNTWILYRSESSYNTNQMANLGVNSFFEVIDRTTDSVVLFTNHDMGVFDNIRYYKLNSSFLSLGSCLLSYGCDSQQISWQKIAFSGTWALIYPGYFLYGPSITTNTTKITYTG